jgi:hypothetical protein
VLEYTACSSHYRENTTSANLIELGVAIRKLFKASYDDHPLDYYIVLIDLEKGYFVEAGFFAGKSMVQAIYVMRAVYSSLMNDL